MTLVFILIIIFDFWVMFRIIIESSVRGYKYRMLLRIHRLLATDVINNRTMGVMINDLDEARTPADLKILEEAITLIEHRQDSHSL